MNYEFHIEADHVDDLVDTLTAIVSALRMARVPGVIRFARTPSANDDYPLQRVEPHVAQAVAEIAKIAEEEAELPAPVRRRRRRSVNGSGSDEELVAPVVVQNPDGNVVAVTREMAVAVPATADPVAAQVEAAPAAPVAAAPAAASVITDPAAFPPEGMKPPPEDTPDMSTSDMRERAINLMQQAFGYAAGPDLVRAVHRRLKVRKISDVPDDRCRELLDDATAILTQLKASGELLDLLGMAAGKK